MSLNRDFLGRTFSAPTTYEVGRQKLAEFADAVGDAHEVFRSIGAAEKLGYPDVIAPPTFAITLTASSAEPLVLDPELGLDYSLIVHGEQSFVHHRPIHAGDVLTTGSTITSIKDAGANELLETQTEIRAADGELVCVSTNLIISRGSAASPAEPGLRPPTERPTGEPVGTAVPIRKYGISRLDLVRYAGASGDFNVIHWNERVAQSVGLPDVIAHGMFTMALGARYVGEWCGDPGAIVEYRVRFSRPVPVPDDGLGAEVEFGAQAGSEVVDGVVTVALTATSASGSVLSGAIARVRATAPLLS
jgi:acyl dehydratase